MKRIFTALHSIVVLRKLLNAKKCAEISQKLMHLYDLFIKFQQWSDSDSDPVYSSVPGKMKNPRETFTDHYIKK